jgi:hypothetical protein
MPKFKLKTKVAKLDEVPEAFRSAYTERDGAFHLDEFEYDDAAELKTTLERVKEERKQAKADLARYEGIDPVKAREAQKRLDELDEKQLIDKGEYDRLNEKRQKEYDAKEAEWKKQLAERDARLDEHELLSPIRDAALKSGLNPKHIKNVVKITRERFKLNDKRKPVVLDDEGDETAHSLEQFWGESFKTDFPEFYLPTGAGGSGASTGTTGGGGNSKTMKREEFEQLDQRSRADFLKDKGTLTD